MKALDDGITAALFCQKWIFHWNDTCVEIEHILQAIIISSESEPDLDSLNNEQREGKGWGVGGRGGGVLSLIFFKTYKSSPSGVSVGGVADLRNKKKRK